MSKPTVLPVVLHITPAQAQKAAQTVQRAIAPKPALQAQKKQRPSAPLSSKPS